jgi:putative PEP-CTERM system TPR-repeat lipoprotein
MLFGKSPRIAAFSLSALVLASVAGCGGESTDSLLKSARDYVAKKDYKAAVIQAKNALQKNPELGEARYLLGKALLDSGDVVAAEVELRKAQRLQYVPDQVVPPLARSLILQGQFKKAIDEFASAPMESAEAKADLATTIGAAQAALGDTAAAEASIARALAAAPDFAPALTAQARLKAVKGDMDGALVLVDALLAKHADDFEAWKLKGDLLAVRGKRDEAISAYRKSVDVKPAYVVGHSVLVTSLLQAGKADEAGKALEQMKKNAPRNPLTTYVSAQYAYEQKDFKSARESIEQLLKITPDNGAALQLAGAIEFQQRSYTRAEDYFLKALKDAPDNGLSRRLLILAYLRQGQPAKALAAIDPILGKIENDANMLALAGDVYLQNGNTARAEEYFSKANKLDPDDPAKKTSLAMAHMARGNVEAGSLELEKIAASDKGTSADMALISSLLRRNEFDKALKALDVLEKKQPNNPATYNLKGRTLVAKRDIAAARQNFEKALQIDPSYLPAATGLAGLDLLEKNVAQAKKRYESVLAADPKNAAAMLAAAELSSRTGGTQEEFVGWINKAIAAKPTDVAARLALISNYLRMRDGKKALAAAQDALAVIPDQPDILEALGRSQAVAGDTNQALSTFAKLSNLQANSPLPYLRMAEVQVAGNMRDDAIQSLRKALQIKPDFVDARSGLVELLVGMQRQEEALAIALELERQQPQEPAGYVLEGEIHDSKKDWPKAIAAYRNGLKQAPSQQTAVKLHVALLNAGNKAEAAAFAQSWVKEHPRDVAFRANLGDRAIAAKDYPTAIAHYRAALEVQPNNPLILNNLAWVLGQTKHPQALEYAETANRLAPDQPALMDTLAGILADAGKFDRALPLMERAVSLAPQQPSIRLSYAETLIKAGKKPEAKQQLQELEKLGDKFSQQASVKQLLGSL